MKKLLFALAALLFVACGNKVAQPVPAEEEDLSIKLPEYKRLSTDVPKKSSDGSISPIENLVYNIEIDHPLPKDSLGLLQDYFIQKGKADYVGINKVIVRAYLKGTSIYGTPYASMNLVGSEKEIIINNGAEKIEELIKKPSKEAVKEEPTDPLVGTYFCNRTHDTYRFFSDKTGFFNIQGGSPSTFTWKRSGENVTIVYEVFGKQYLLFNQKAKTITEKSESFGTLVFKKQ